RWVELPFSTIGLVWNSMMSMAGGWFFLMITESFVLGSRDFRLPGIGSYMSVAVASGNVPAMLWAIFAMVMMIVVLDQLLWRPVVVWSQKFRVEEGADEETASSWFYDWIRRSMLIDWIESFFRKLPGFRNEPRRAPAAASGRDTRSPHLSIAMFAMLMLVLLSTALGTLWTLPAGLAIGLNPRLSRIFQPIVQVAASFPAPMLFPLVIA